MTILSEIEVLHLKNLEALVATDDGTPKGKLLNEESIKMIYNTLLSDLKKIEGKPVEFDKQASIVYFRKHLCPIVRNNSSREEFDSLYMLCCLLTDYFWDNFIIKFWRTRNMDDVPPFLLSCES
jgi:hypothetical protein